MFWHDDISMHDEAVLAASFFEDFQEQVATFGGFQLRLPPEATTGYKMQVLIAVVSDESFGHAAQSKDRGRGLSVILIPRDGDETHSFAKYANEMGHPRIPGPPDRYR